MKDLPHFQSRPYEHVSDYISQILSREPNHTYLIHLERYPDGHYRATFNIAYFTVAEGHDKPSKSQWNSLKKKMKRHDPKVFVFKDYGYEGEKCFIEFGFLAP